MFEGIIGNVVIPAGQCGLRGPRGSWFVAPMQHEVRNAEKFAHIFEDVDNRILSGVRILCPLKKKFRYRARLRLQTRHNMATLPFSGSRALI
jgi:hypothetical protein